MSFRTRVVAAALTTNLSTLSDSLNDLIPDYDFSMKTNLVLFGAKTFNPDKALSLPLRSQLKFALEHYGLLTKALVELKKLAAKNKLPKSDKLSKLVKAVEKLAPEIEKVRALLTKFDEVKKEATKLGFAV